MQQAEGFLTWKNHPAGLPFGQSASISTRTENHTESKNDLDWKGQGHYVSSNTVVNVMDGAPSQTRLLRAQSNLPMNTSRKGTPIVSQFTQHSEVLSLKLVSNLYALFYFTFNQLSPLKSSDHTTEKRGKKKTKEKSLIKSALFHVNKCHLPGQEVDLPSSAVELQEPVPVFYQNMLVIDD